MLIRIAGGTFTMGSDRFYPEEAPPRSVSVDEFWIDSHPVTNDEYAAFVHATGYVTVAERPLDLLGRSWRAGRIGRTGVARFYADCGAG